MFVETVSISNSLGGWFLGALPYLHKEDREGAGQGCGTNPETAQSPPALVCLGKDANKTCYASPSARLQRLNA